MTTNRIEVVDIGQLTPDENNANAGTERGGYMLDYSIGFSGPARSVVADRHGTIVAGNKTHAAAGAAGIEKAVILHTTGDALVVVMRDDFDLSEEGNPARTYAYLDNQSSAVGLAWDAKQIAADHVSGAVDFMPIMFDDELAALLKAAAGAEETPGLDGLDVGGKGEQWRIILDGYDSEAAARADVGRDWSILGPAKVEKYRGNK